MYQFDSNHKGNMCLKYLSAVFIFIAFLNVNSGYAYSVDMEKDNRDFKLMEEIVSANSILNHTEAEYSSTDLDELQPVNNIYTTMIWKKSPKSESVLLSRFTCFPCKFGVSLLKGFVKRGGSEEEFGVLVSNLCEMFHIMTPRVCSGMGKSYQRQGKMILSSDIDISAKELCGFQIEICADSKIPPHNWSVPLPQSPKPPVKVALPTKENAPVMRVLHISDIHVDRFYKAGSDANCGEPLCCRESSGKPATSEDAAGYWGDHRECDIPFRTLENMLDHINKTHEIDYVIYTGDFVPHDIWNYTRQEVIYLLHLTSELIHKYLGHVPIFPTLGNHDTSPANSFPAVEVEDEDSIDWLYDEVEKAWSDWVPERSSVKLGGYYSTEVHPNFRIISLNMNYCHSFNWWLLLNQKDPAGQLAWLVEQLQMAEDKGEKVHIIGHIPPGVHECFGVWSSNYNKIINRYESTVTGQFFGHTHRDEFEIFYDKSGQQPRATNIAYIGPSASPYHGGNNPAYRIYTVDGNYPESSKAVLNHETYFMNLTEANLSMEPKWNLQYSAKEAYHMSSLSPAEWDRLLQKFDKDDEAFQMFVRFFNKLSDSSTEKCSGACKRGHLCKLRRAQSNDPPIC